jgi:regulatory protein
VDAVEAALGALARKERTVAELRAWLEARAFEPAAIEQAIDRLRELGQLDDERFARRYAEDKRELSGWGPERIGEALSEREVAPEAIAAALGADAGAGDEADRAARLLAGRGDPLRDELARSRAFAYLRRRGYPAEIAYDAVRRAERLRDAA